MTTQFALQSAVKFPVALWIESPERFAYQGCTAGTFKVYLYTEDNASHHVDLYAQGSHSIPYQTPQNKWSHLNPQWRFEDADHNVINSLTLSNAVTAEFNGTTGYKSSAEFYYYDDMPTLMNCDIVLIWGVVDFSDYPTQKDITGNSQSVPSYANSKVIAVAPYYINALTPTEFVVYRDGLNNMSDFYWINGFIPHVVSVVGTSQTDTCTAVMKNVPPYSNTSLGLSGGSLARSIPGIDNTHLTWTPSNTSTYLSALDYQHFNVGGYVRGKVVSDVVADNVAISAMGTVWYENIPVHYPYLWISNPENNTMNRVFAPCIPDKWVTTDTPFMIELGQKVYDTSYMQVTTLTDIMSLTGFHGVYGIAFDGFNNIWLADAESDMIYKLDPYGVRLSSISAESGSTPAGITVDGSNNVWVTFFDSMSTIYIDGVTGDTITTINPGDTLDSSIDPSPAFKPVLAESDKNDDVWVTYGNTLCSSLVKYTTAGIILGTITLPACSNPMDIFITKSNDVWVSLTHFAGPPYGKSTVSKYFSGANNQTPLLSFPAFNPGYLAMDSQESLWFTQSGNVLTRITSAGVITNWSVGTAGPSSYIPPQTDTYELNVLGGLCCDIYDKIWVINSIENQLYTIRNDNVVLAIKITPDQNLTWYNDTPTHSIYTETSDNTKSAQAFGDWSGNRWIRKYSNLDITYLSAGLMGTSSPFNIYDFNGYDIRRFNESWDASNEVKKFARSPHIADNPVLWDKYMKSVWGDETSPDGKGFGRDIYEKTANFAINHIDVNACNMDQLYSLAQYTDVPIDVYGVSLPTDLKRIMDIGSVNQQLLWGSRCKCHRNIANTYTTYTSSGQLVPTDYLCPLCNHYHPGNRGDLFNPMTYMVTAYTPFIIEDRTNNNNRFQMITPPLSCHISTNDTLIGDICQLTATSSVCLTTYPLSSFYNMLLPAMFTFNSTPNLNDFEQITTYFCFYNYIPSEPCTEQIAGIINWDDPYTTLNETASSIDEWYGNGQTLERIINYILHKGLGLIGNQ